MTTTVRGLLLVLILILAASTLIASGGVGVYAIVSKVVLEPDDKAPERIQIWGAFTLVDGGTGSGGKTLTPQRGYLYFTLPSIDGGPYQRMVALKEWADFKAIAGTGQAVAFGGFGYGGVFSGDLISRPSGGPSSVCIGKDPVNTGLCRTESPVRGESTAPTSPITFPMNIGLIKLSSTGDLAAVVKQLQETLKR
ncbi:MAG TPA: hypothetical protein VK210_02570 [Terriglobia bacterium]|nr:hypothetical protein [Terriglobia bacterium]